MTATNPAFVLEGARRILAEWPDAEHLRDLIQTTEEAINAGSDWAIDGAKCLVECVCKTILEEHGAEFESSDSPAKLVRRTANCLGLTDEDGNDALRDIVSGLITATNGLSALRNSSGPLGHGRHALHPPLGHRHRRLAISTAEAVVVTLYEAHTAKPLNLRHTRKGFDHDAEINVLIDGAVEVWWDIELGQIILNGFLAFRPSEILYSLDRGAYVELFKELENTEPGDELDVGAS